MSHNIRIGSGLRPGLGNRKWSYEICNQNNGVNNTYNHSSDVQSYIASVFNSGQWFCDTLASLTVLHLFHIDSMLVVSGLSTDIFVLRNGCAVIMILVGYFISRQPQTKSVKFKSSSVLIIQNGSGAHKQLSKGIIILLATFNQYCSKLFYSDAWRLFLRRNSYQYCSQGR